MPKRSKHSLSHYKLLTCDMGELIPVALTEVLPGDSIQQATSVLVRLSPMLAPVFHPTKVRVDHYFVPHRLVWSEWEDFITGGPTGVSAPAVPTRTDNVAEGSVFDYMGVPPLNYAGKPFSALPLRGYQLIWNEHYRDQDLQTEAVVSLASGADVTTAADLKRCSWEKDYFTLARPFEQKGAAVVVPLSGRGPVQAETGPGVFQSLQTSSQLVGAADRAVELLGDGDPGAAKPLWADGVGFNVDINDLRFALGMQKFKEWRARFGSRYTEYLRSLGVRSSDARLQRPEYLGGSVQTIQMSEVLQTAPDTSGTPSPGVGRMRGHGIGALRSRRWRRFFEEHGFVFSLMSIRPRAMYSDGLNRMWSRTAKEHYWQRELEHVGQQEILNKEVRAAHATPLGIFGFGDRYDEYRRGDNGVAGQFRSTLNFWHLGRQFAADPVLNSAFITLDPGKRIFAVGGSEDVAWCMAFNSIQARRLVSRDATPGIRF